MALPITIPNTFATATNNIPLSQLDTNFTTVSTAINGIGNGSETLANVAITGGTATNLTANVVSISNATITGGSIIGITPIAVISGGTGSNNAATARTNLSAAASGANSDITALSGLTTALSVAQGGTGSANLTANSVVVGNGTSAVSGVAPSTSGNVLTSNGTTWTSSALSSLSVFDKSLTTNGYQKLPGGLIMQWCRGTASSSETSQTVNFPITFPTATLAVQASTFAPSTADRMVQVTSFTTSSVTVFLNSIGGAGGDITPYIFAIGY
jgi:hypothetical protein